MTNKFKQNKSNAWKVVKVSQNNKYISVWTYGYAIYKINEWTYPCKGFCYPFLYVLETRQQARNFYKYLKFHNPEGTFKIFKCEVKNPTRSRWFLYFNKHKFVFSKDPMHPDGTLFVDAVKLTTLIK